MNFNPFKKSNQAKEQKRAAVWAADEQAIDEAFKRAEAVADPAEKVLALRQIRDAIDNMLLNERTAIANEARKKSRNAAMGTMLPLFAGGLATAAIVSGPLGWLGVGAMFGGQIGGDIVKYVRNKNVTKKLELTAADHLQYLRNKKDAVAGILETTVTEHVPEISKSPLQGQIMLDASLSKTFADAAAKHVVAQEQEVAKLKEAQERAKAEARPDFKKDYQKLADVMKPPAEKSAAKKPRAQKGAPKPDGQ